MLAGGSDGGCEKAEQFLKERSLSSYYDDVALKGLQLAQMDLDREVLDVSRLLRIRDTVVEFTSDLSDQTDHEPMTVKLPTTSRPLPPWSKSQRKLLLRPGCSSSGRSQTGMDR